MAKSKRHGAKSTYFVVEVEKGDVVAVALLEELYCLGRLSASELAFCRKD